MPAPIATSLRSILPLVTTQLTSVTGVTSNRVLLLQRPDTPHFQGDSDLLLRIGPAQPEEGFSHGAGRVAVVLGRTLQITARARRAVDESDRDDYALLDATSGLLALEESAINALHIWVPTDDDDNWLTVEPIHWIPGGQLLHETPLHQSWLHSDLVFHFRYQLSVTDNGF
jgi:hypothetical protein